MGHLGGVLPGFGHLIQQPIAHLHQTAGLEVVELLNGAGFLHLVGSHAEQRVIMVQRMGSEGHVIRADAVVSVDVLNVLPYQAALDMIGFQIRHGHNHHVRIHLHHQRNELHFADVIGLDARLVHGEHRILGVRGNIMDHNVGMLQHVVDHARKVFIEAAALAVEYQLLMLLVGQEPMIIIVLLLFIGLQLLFLLGVLCLKLLQILFALLQLCIVDVLGGLVEEVHKVEVGNGKEVTGNPVKTYAGRHQIGEVGGECHGKNRHTPAAQEALLLLEDVIPVLRPAQQERRAAGQQRHQGNQRNGKHRRHLRQVDAQEHGVKTLRRGNNPHNVYPRQLIGKSHEVAIVCTVAHCLNNLELCAAAQFVHTQQLRRSRHKGLAGGCIDPQKVLHGIVDNVNESQHQNDLNNHRHHAQHGAVMLPLIQGNGLVRNGVLIAIMLRGNPVDFRLETNHFNGVFLHHHRQGQQNDLAEQGKQQNCNAIALYQLVAEPHQPSQGNADASVNQ